MKVLLTHHRFLPNQRAGSELYTYYVARALLEAKFPTELFFAEYSDHQTVERRHFDELPCTVLRKPDTPINLFAESSLWVDEVFADCVRRFRPDVVHINHLLYLSTNLPKIAKDSGAAVVFTLHDFWLSCPRYTRLDHREELCEATSTLKCTGCCRVFYTRFAQNVTETKQSRVVALSKAMLKPVLSRVLETYPAFVEMSRREDRMHDLVKYVDRFISPSRFLGNALLTWGIPSSRMAIIPYGMPKPTTRLDRGLRDGPLKFAFIGTLARHKGVHLLLDAFRDITEAELSIFGQSIAAFSVSHRDVLDKPNVHFRGLVTDSEKPRVFASIDALIVPSIWFENAPLVIQEALIAGVPVVSADIGGMRELVQDGINGFHFRAGSADDLRRVLKSCIETPDRLRSLVPSGDQILSVTQHVRSQLIPLYESLRRKDQTDG